MFKYLIRKAGIPVLIFGFLSATVFADDTDTLSARQQAIIPIAAHTASGDIAALNTALADGLDAGLTVNEIKEIFIHAYAYVGFPRALNGINAFNRVVDNRKSNGINDKLGKSATPVPENFDDNAYGHEVRNGLVGRDISNRTTGYAAFVPTIDVSGRAPVCRYLLSGCTFNSRP